MAGLPPVSKCEVDQCFYNRERACHAPAINVGDGTHPACDTFIATGEHMARNATGMVGACHVSACVYNEQLTCGARAIDVANHAGHADCATFRPA